MTGTTAGSRSARAIALMVSLSLHLWVVWLLLAPSGSVHSEREQTAKPRAPTHAGQWAQRSPEQTTAPARDARASTPKLASDDKSARSVRSRLDPDSERSYQAGLAFEQKRQVGIHRLHRQMYGDDIAVLMDLPLKQAWPRLESLALEGDRAAGEALTELTCVPLPRSAADADRIAPHLTRNLGPSDAAFVSGALHAEFNSESEHQVECAVTGFGVPRLQQLLESKLGPMPGELANATPMERWDAVVGAWRESFGTRDPQILLAPDDSLTLVIRRLYDTESESHPEDVELLLAAIDTNPLALQIYASCLMNGCNGIAALPPGERLSWSLRAAKIGAEPAIDDVVAQMQSVGDAVTAAAWAEFHRALALAGCNTVPNGGNVASAMLGADRATRGLSPNERALANARAQELIERYGAQARAAQGCE